MEDTCYLLTFTKIVDKLVLFLRRCYNVGQIGNLSYRQHSQAEARTPLFCETLKSNQHIKIF